MDFTAVLVAEDQNPWERIAAEVLANPAYDSTAARVKAFVQRDSKRGQAFLGISRIWGAQDLSCPGVTPPFVNYCTLRSGARSLMQAIESVRSGGKLVGVSWCGAPLEIDNDLLRERSVRVLFPNISTLADLEHTVRLVGSGRGRLKPMITHVLNGLEAVPWAFEITANKGIYQAINPAQVIPCP